MLSPKKEQFVSYKESLLCSCFHSSSAPMSSTQMEPKASTTVFLKKKMSAPLMKKLHVPTPLHRTFSEYLTPKRRTSSITPSTSTEMTKGDSLPSGMGNWGSSESLSPEVLRRKANKLGELADKCQRLNSVVGGIVVESKEQLQVDDIIIGNFAFCISCLFFIF